MKESNLLANNVEKNFQLREMLGDTKGQYMRELNTLVDNAAKNFLKAVVLKNTKILYINKNWKMIFFIFDISKIPQTKLRVLINP